MLRLPDELQSHLNDPSILSARNAAETSRRSRTIRCTEIHLVKGIEEFAAELKLERLVECEVFDHCEVRTDLGRSADEASPSVSVDASGQLVDGNERGGIKERPPHRIPVGVIDLHAVSRCACHKLSMLIVVAGGAIQCDVSAHDDVQWRPALKDMNP